MCGVSAYCRVPACAVPVGGAIAAIRSDSNRMLTRSYKDGEFTQHIGLSRRDRHSRMREKFLPTSLSSSRSPLDVAWRFFGVTKKATNFYERFLGIAITKRVSARIPPQLLPRSTGGRAG